MLASPAVAPTPTGWTLFHDVAAIALAWGLRPGRAHAAAPSLCLFERQALLSALVEMAGSAVQTPGMRGGWGGCPPAGGWEEGRAWPPAQPSPGDPLPELSCSQTMAILRDGAPGGGQIKMCVSARQSPNLPACSHHDGAPTFARGRVPPCVSTHSVQMLLGICCRLSGDDLKITEHSPGLETETPQTQPGCWEGLDFYRRGSKMG